MKKEEGWKIFLADVKDGRQFNYHKHGSIKNVIDLLWTIKSSSENEFNHHVTQSRNDFAAWIKEVLKDSDLASQLKNTKDKAKTARLIEHRINEASAYVAHQQEPHLHTEKKKLPDSPKLQDLVRDIQKLEHDLNHTLGHTSKSALFTYDPDDKANPHKNYSWKEFTVGALAGVILGLLIARISGIV